MKGKWEGGTLERSGDLMERITCRGEQRDGGYGVWGGPEDPQYLSNFLERAQEVEAQGQIRRSQLVGSNWPVNGAQL